MLTIIAKLQRIQVLSPITAHRENLLWTSWLPKTKKNCFSTTKQTFYLGKFFRANFSQDQAEGEEHDEDSGGGGADEEDGTRSNVFVQHRC